VPARLDRAKFGAAEPAAILQQSQSSRAGTPGIKRRLSDVRSVVFRTMHRESFMRIHIPCTALGLALAGVAPAAHAETIVTRHIVSQPVETVRTVTTTRTTTRTIRPAVHRRVVVTRRTAGREQVAPVAPAPAIAAAPPIYDAAAPALPTPYPEPIYDVGAPVPPAPIANTYPQPVYDVAAPVPAIVAPAVDETLAAPAVPVPPDAVGPPMPTYHYVYEWDRILVIDDATGIAVQALPR